MAGETEALPQINIDVGREWQKPRLVALLFCEGANLTTDGKANIWSVFDRIIVDPARKISGAFTVFIRTAQTTPEQDVEVVIVAPNNEPVASLSYAGVEEVEAEGRPVYVHFIGRIGIKTPVEGVYWFNVSYKGETLGGGALAVQFQKPEVTEDEHGSNS